jgi:hypothetical protein
MWDAEMWRAGCGESFVDSVNMRGRAFDTLAAMKYTAAMNIEREALFSLFMRASE